MTPEDFAALVREMRAAQRAYFRHRTTENQLLSMSLERQVDAALRDLALPSPDVIALARKEATDA